MRLGIAALVLLACSAANGVGVPGTDPAVRGIITRVNVSGEKIGTVLIEEVPSDSSGSAKFSVTIKQGTRIFTRLGESVRKTDFAALRTGQVVEAWFSGPVMESYPARATAEAIVVIP